MVLDESDSEQWKLYWPPDDDSEARDRLTAIELTKSLNEFEKKLFLKKVIETHQNPEKKVPVKVGPKETTF
ncbi:MAG: hypothetical protein M1827_005840 [Pycnora praestabilis]|nr:MAG: hypothetical protein M1827_005840 [Pycnora praestabilis]